MPIAEEKGDGVEGRDLRLTGELASQQSLDSRQADHYTGLCLDTVADEFEVALYEVAAIGETRPGTEFGHA